MNTHQPFYAEALQGGLLRLAEDLSSSSPVVNPLPREGSPLSEGELEHQGLRLVIKDGKIVARIGKEELVRGGEKTYEVTLGKKEDFIKLSHSSAFPLLSKDEGKRTLLFRFADSALPSFLESIKDLDIVDFIPHKETLRELFLSYYREERTFAGI